jgi:hypothetical protein
VLPGRQDKVIPYPNPSNGGKVWLAFQPGGNKVSLRIYDLLGELVAKQEAQANEAQNGLMAWDGGGGKLGSGVYVLVVFVDGKRHFGKLAIIEPGYGGGGIHLPGYLQGP